MPTYITTASVLRLRSEPVDGTIIGRLPRGTELESLNGPTNGWVRVRATLLDGKAEGWVSATYIESKVDVLPIVEPTWLAIARAEIGVKEYPGAEHNLRIVEYFESCLYQATTDETPWCSAFVNWCMQQAGIERTQSAMARSWLKWGKALKEPEHGCVVVFSRGTDKNSGHVAFYLETRGNGILVLGGNQSNSVCITSYAAGRVLGWRSPE